MKKLFRMELVSDIAPTAPPESTRIVAYCPSLHRGRIPLIYAEAFGEKPWPDDWDDFDEFDPKGIFLATDPPTDKIIGYVISFRRKDFGYISVLAVLPTYRRQGIASALIKTAIQYLRSLGVSAVRVDVHVTNTPAIQAYKKLGFEVVDTFKE